MLYFHLSRVLTSALTAPSRHMCLNWWAERSVMSMTWVSRYPYLEVGGFNVRAGWIQSESPGLLPCLPPRPLGKPVLSFNPGQPSAPPDPVPWAGTGGIPTQTFRNLPQQASGPPSGFAVCSPHLQFYQARAYCFPSKEMPSHLCSIEPPLGSSSSWFRFHHHVVSGPLPRT